MLKLKQFVLASAIAFAGSAMAKPVFIDGVVPHYYQWNGSPSRVYACGHAALQSAGDYVKGQYYSLSNLHTIMYRNSSSGYGAKRCSNGTIYCASLYDLDMAANSHKNGGYGTHYQYSSRYSGLRDVPTPERLLQKVKDGIQHKTPPIAPSNWDISYGHFYVIVGYDQKANLDDTILYLRDPYKSRAVYTKYDVKTTLKNFHDHMDGYKKQVLFVKR